MEAFLASTAAVAIAEIGDKTQLLSLFLVVRYGKRLPIVMGILLATVLNHALSAYLGAWIAQWIPQAWLPWILAISFIAIAGWLLIPDKDDSDDSRFLGLGAFAATTVMFFLAEIGDKTQIATVVLAARFTETLWVVIGTTVGMLIANIPVIMAGRWLMERLPLTTARIGASLLFVALAVATVVATVMNSGA
ncbi:TMEM165/GDT1 family protein [Marinobacter salinisoli]|uniref:GDT1 family protein n=1 Tax=Marinobacter salinisoli TaxID=2769486 RepID=A0ABX7MU13_9GAMM|nr:TMEM165/GDT1 family protein [Marinobacter salinisoli]QSP95659.1 TMEM165/GDT1 family protein [Marinobacter salinisoli]